MSHEKAYTVTLEDRAEYFYARVTAPRTDKDISIRIATEITGACRSAGRDRMLVERNIENGVSTTSAYMESATLEEIARGLQIAVIEADPAQFGHVERGIRFYGPNGLNIKAFRTREEAEAWLRAV